MKPCLQCKELSCVAAVDDFCSTSCFEKWLEAYHRVPELSGTVLYGN